MSDPALDAWLAEHVMGWRQDGDYWVNPDNNDDEYTVRPLSLSPSDTDWWQPSSRPEQALEVTSRVISHFNADVFVLRFDVAKREHWEWQAAFGDHLGDSFPEDAPTPALALCRAARAWAEGREGQG